jgi:hypothetical protein
MDIAAVAGRVLDAPLAETLLSLANWIVWQD